jgi:hypothetical protein
VAADRTTAATPATADLEIETRIDSSKFSPRRRSIGLNRTAERRDTGCFDPEASASRPEPPVNEKLG